MFTSDRASAGGRVAGRGQRGRLEPLARRGPRGRLHGARGAEGGAGQTLPRVALRGGDRGGFVAHAGEARRDRPVEIVEVEGLRDVVEGAQLERFLGEADVLVRGHHDDRDVPVDLADFPEDLHPVEPGHADVEEHEVGPTAANHGQRLGTAPRPLDRVTLCGEVLGQHLAHGGLVIDDQDPSKGHQQVFYPRDLS